MHFLKFSETKLVLGEVTQPFKCFFEKLYVCRCEIKS